MRNVSELVDVCFDDFYWICQKTEEIIDDVKYFFMVDVNYFLWRVWFVISTSNGGEIVGEFFHLLGLGLMTCLYIYFFLGIFVFAIPAFFWNELPIWAKLSIIIPNIILMLVSIGLNTRAINAEIKAEIEADRKWQKQIEEDHKAYEQENQVFFDDPWP